MPKTKEKEVISDFRKVARKEEKLEIAKNLKNKGFEIKVISEVTGLTIEEIQNL